MSKPGHTGLTRVIKATRFSWQGLRAAWRYESAFRQETLLGVVLVPCAFLLGETLTQIALLIAVYLLVLLTELLNSAIETVVDRIGKEHNDLAGRAKDMGSAAVFISLVALAITWGLVALQQWFFS